MVHVCRRLDAGDVSRCLKEDWRDMGAQCVGLLNVFLEVPGLLVQGRGAHNL
jgi:hypothetical protein